MAFCRSSAFEALYGGAAGGGKSDALLVEGTRQVGNPHYRAILLRRTFPELERAGGLIDRSMSLYPMLGARYAVSARRWHFPSGASIEFGHLQEENDKLQYQGAQFQYIGFDELTHFTLTQYLYLFSRCRSPEGTGLRCYIRSGTNPGGPGHEWVKKRWAHWLDQRRPDRGQPGAVYHYAQVDGEEAEVEAEHPDARSRTFVGARVTDNPYLAGTDYERNLRALPLVERKRLLEGDWDIMPARGLVFQRQWFPIVRALPADTTAVRFWDLAGTAKKAASQDPDYTVGAKLCRSGDGAYYVEHVIRSRLNWGEVKRLVRQTAELDGPDVRIGIEQEPGSSGKAVIEEMVRALDGYAASGYPAQGDKVVRAGPWAAQAEVGNVRLMANGWNDAFLDECVMFPEGSHDDQVDAVSGAYAMLTSGATWLVY